MCVLTRPCGRPPSNCSRPKGLPRRVGWPSAEPPFLLSLQAGPNSSENDREWNFLATARVPCLDPILPRATGCYWATLLESHPSSAKSDWWMRVPCMDRHSVMTSTKRAVPCGFRGERTKKPHGLEDWRRRNSLFRGAGCLRNLVDVARRFSSRSAPGVKSQAWAGGVAGILVRVPLR
jgi:hypothetical protein